MNTNAMSSSCGTPAESAESRSSDAIVYETENERSLPTLSSTLRRPAMWGPMFVEHSPLTRLSHATLKRGSGYSVALWMRLVALGRRDVPLSASAQPMRRKRSRARHEQELLVGTTVVELCETICQATGREFKGVHALVAQKAERLRTRMAHSLLFGSAADCIHRGVALRGVKRHEIRANGRAPHASHYPRLNCAVGAAAALVLSFAAFAPAELRVGDLTTLAVEMHAALRRSDGSIYADARNALLVEVETMERGIYAAKAAVARPCASAIQECAAFVEHAWPTESVDIPLPVPSSLTTLPTVTPHMLEAAEGSLAAIATATGDKSLASHAGRLDELQALHPRELHKLALSPLPTSSAMSLSQVSTGLWSHRRPEHQRSESYGSYGSYGSSTSASSSSSFGFSCMGDDAAERLGDESTSVGGFNDAIFAFARLQGSVQEAAALGTTGTTTGVHRTYTPYERV